MKLLKNIIPFFSLLISAGCSTNAYDKKLNGGYYLLALHSYEEMSLGYEENNIGIGIISATVFELGQNENYIIAKQHPRVFPNGPQKNITNYFIIPIKHKISENAEKNILGPLTYKEFEQTRSKLVIQGIKFSIVFNNLE